MIREHPRFQKLAMIFVSGVQIAETDHLRGYEIGAVDYVTVPVVPEVLRAKVKVFIELYRKTRQLEELNRELEQRVAARTAEIEAPDRAAAPERGAPLDRARRPATWVRGDRPRKWKMDWDEGMFRIFDVDPVSFVPAIEKVEAMIHPDDVEKNSVATLLSATRRDSRSSSGSCGPTARSGGAIAPASSRAIPKAGSPA